MLYLKLAVRNLMRNKRRTFIAGSAIGIGLAALILMDAVMIGMEHNLVASATESLLGEGQIHARGYRENLAVEEAVVDGDGMMAALGQDTLIAAYTRRAMAFAMITSPANLSAVTMIGIDPTTEPALSLVDEAVIEGSYLQGNNPRDILIGSKLAEILETRIGARVVLTTAQAHTGDLAQEMFRVSGIYHFNVDAMDRSMVFIRLPQAQTMLGLGDDFHEIAMTFSDGSYGRNKQSPVWQHYSQNGNEAVSWTTILPEIEALFELSKVGLYVGGLILFAVVSLGIVNTLFMSLYERMFEFGVLRAVGTRAIAMARLILLEAGALALLSIILGSILGLVLTGLFSHYGIDYTGIEFSGVTFREMLYPALTLDQFVVYPCGLFVFTLLVGLYPAAYAARMKPAEAMRRSF
ncbi:MAG: ABC transporter permease [candidate division Zixibacteria bacterium]|nr:ABC transporter permease [candidate division Zixibacteria bacterium]